MQPDLCLVSSGETGFLLQTIHAERTGQRALNLPIPYIEG